MGLMVTCGGRRPASGGSRQGMASGLLLLHDARGDVEVFQGAQVLHAVGSVLLLERIQLLLHLLIVDPGALLHGGSLPLRGRWALALAARLDESHAPLARPQLLHLELAVVADLLV